MGIGRVERDPLFPCGLQKTEVSLIVHFGQEGGRVCIGLEQRVATLRKCLLHIARPERLFKAIDAIASKKLVPWGVKMMKRIVKADHVVVDPKGFVLSRAIRPRHA